MSDSNGGDDDDDVLAAGFLGFGQLVWVIVRIS